MRMRNIIACVYVFDGWFIVAEIVKTGVCLSLEQLS